MNTNLQTKPSITFNCVVLSRLSYFTSNHFLSLYLNIFGPIIPVSELQEIDNISFDNNSIDNNILKNDKELADAPSSKKSQIFKTDTKLQLNNVVDNINTLIKKSVSVKPGIKSFNPPVKEITTDNHTVAYMSIATSNYGGYYILVDTRMPKSIFVIFRGTYSEDSASSYLKPSSLKPYYGENKEYAVLKGISKLLSDVFHSIIESMVYLSETYLKSETLQNGEIKVFTTGHSLGGGLATLFANRWGGFTDLVSKSDNIYSSNETYKKFHKTICCLAIASPRVLNKSLASDFCKRIEEGKIIYTRLKTRGDPVPSLPPDALGFAHPCSDDTAKEAKVSFKSKSPRKIGLPGYNMLGPGNSKKPIEWEPAGKFRYENNPFSHTNYYYINFANAVDLKAFASSYLLQRKIAGETSRYNGDTVARFLLGVSNIKPPYAIFKHAFINLMTSRKKNANKKIGIDVEYDSYITRENFQNDVINKLIDITGRTNLNYTKPEVDNSIISINQTNGATKPYVKISPSVIDFEQQEILPAPAPAVPAAPVPAAPVPAAPVPAVPAVPAAPATPAPAVPAAPAAPAVPAVPAPAGGSCGSCVPVHIIGGKKTRKVKKSQKHNKTLSKRGRKTKNNKKKKNKHIKKKKKEKVT